MNTLELLAIIIFPFAIIMLIVSITTFAIGAVSYSTNKNISKAWLVVSSLFGIPVVIYILIILAVILVNSTKFIFNNLVELSV